MNNSMRLTRDLVHMLMFASGAAAATYGWGSLLIFVPTSIICYWSNHRIEQLIRTAVTRAMKLSAIIDREGE